MMQLLGNSTPLSGAGDRLIDTVQDVGGGLNTIAQSNQEGTESAAYGIGETVWSAATLGRAQETRDEYLSQDENYEDAAENDQEWENADGPLDKAGAFNEQLKRGLDFTFDNPTFNVQDTVNTAATSVSGAEDAEDLADASEDIHAGYEAAQEPLGDAYKSTIEAGFDATGFEAPMGETVLKEAPGTAAEWFVEQPAEAAITAGTGIDPETGETDADPAPIDLLDVALFGGGKAIKGGSKLTEAAKTGGFFDDLGSGSSRLSDSVDLDEAANTATSGLSGALVGGATLLGGAKAGKTMVKGLDEVGKLLGRASSGVDDSATNAAKATDDGVVIEPTSYDSARSVGDTGSLFDDAVTVEAADGAIDDTVASFDEQLNSLTDTVSTGTDDISSTVDDFSGANSGSDLLSGVDDTVDESTTAIDDTVESFDKQLSSLSDTVSGGTDDISSGVDDLSTDSFDEFAAGDGIFNRVWRPFNNSINRLFGSATRVTDDGIVGAGRSGDDAASAADDITEEAVSGTDEADSILGRLGGGSIGDTFRAATRGIGSTGRLVLGGVGVTLALAFTGDALGVNLFGEAPNGNSGDTYRQTSAKAYTKTGFKRLKVEYREADGWNTLGYAVAATDKKGNWVEKGELVVISAAGEPIAAQPMGDPSTDNWALNPRFGTPKAANKAHEDFFEKLREQGYTDEDQDIPSDAEGISGSLEAPDEIDVGEPFTSDWSVETDGISGEAAGRLILAVQTPSGLGTLAESQYDVGPNAPSQDGRFKTPSGWSGLEPGSQTLYAISTGEVEGVVAETSVTITEDGSSTDRSSSSENGSSADRSSSSEDASWGDPEIVQELPSGWYLMAQPRTDGPEQVRFLVVGKRADGDEIYIHPDGTAKTEAHTYPTGEKASAAFQKWAKRNENGTTREGEEASENADRPSQDAVTRDAKQGSGGASGSLARAKKAANENPTQAIAAVAVAAIVGYYAYKKGYLNEPIGWIKDAIPEGVLP